MGLRIAVLWLAGAAFLLAQTPRRQPASAVSRGKALFGNQCVVCHAADSNAKKLGPGLKGLFKRARLQNGKPANEKNVRAVIDVGGNGMPGYKDIFTADQMEDLIAYLKTL